MDLPSSPESGGIPPWWDQSSSGSMKTGISEWEAYVFAGPSSASATGYGKGGFLTAFRVFDFHVSVQGWVGQIGLLT